MKFDIQNLASIIDHTNLKQDATSDDIQKLCKEAIEHDFHAVCVNPYFVKLCKDTLIGNKIKIVTVIGFPLGANRDNLKLNEAVLAINDGADELDMVANISALKEKNYKYVENEIATIRKNIPYNILLKVIVESSHFSDIEIREITKAVMNSGADYIKTSTGIFGGATTAVVKQMYDTADGQILVKASGAIKSLTDCQDMISAGASRIGCSSSVTIMHELRGTN